MAACLRLNTRTCVHVHVCASAHVRVHVQVCTCAAVLSVRVPVCPRVARAHVWQCVAGAGATQHRHASLPARCVFRQRCFLDVGPSQ
eukprot:7873312-Alexandrium_andersonii.AAC.1